jgi:POT family proton-dependent oligopeptide transporter
MNESMLQPNTKTDLLFSGSKFLERIAYYGFRTTCFSYIISNKQNFSFDYSFFVIGLTLLMILTSIIGGLVGDLWLNSKRGLYLGVASFVLGVLFLNLQNQWGLFVGISFIAIGEGFFNSNYHAFFGKVYRINLAAIDSRITMIGLAINVGAFVGGFVFAGFAHEYGYYLTYSILIVCYLLAGVCFYFAQQCAETNSIEKGTIDSNMQERVQQKVVSIGVLLSILIILCFLNFVQDLIYVNNDSLRRLMPSETGKSIPSYMVFLFDYMNIITITVLSVVFMFVWNKQYSSPVVKLIATLILLTVGFGLSRLVPFDLYESSNKLFIVIALITGGMEVLRYPVFYSIIYHYVPQKWYGTSIGIGRGLMVLITFILPPIFLDLQHWDAVVIFVVGFAVLAFCAMGILLIRYQLMRKETSE